MQIRKEVDRVIQWLCWNTGSSDFIELKKSQERMEKANTDVMETKKAYEQIRKDLVNAELEQALSIHNLTETYLKEVPSETETVILLSIKS